MLRKVTIRLHSDIFEELNQEADKRRISFNDLIREIILQRQSVDRSDLKVINSQNHSENNEENKTEPDLVKMEILFLLRSFVFEKAQQSYSKAHDLMNSKFGKDWKKI